MNKGNIQQIGSPQDIYNEPRNAFVAKFIGDSKDVYKRQVREWVVVSGQGAVQAARRADGERRPLQMGVKGVA